MDVPQTRYAKTSDGVSIAYQVLGDGPPDLVWITGWTGGLEVMWEKMEVARFFSKVASFSRLIRHDMRGTGLSDRDVGLPDLETRAADLLAVLDAIDSSRVVMAGSGSGTSLCALFAATYPERTESVILYIPEARTVAAPDWPWGVTPEEAEDDIRTTEEIWGTEEEAARFIAQDIPSFAGDQAWIAWYGKLMRHWVSPRAATELVRRSSEVDVRAVLPTIHVPTLAISRDGFDADWRTEGARVASMIPGARLVSLPGQDAMPWVGDTDPLLHAIETFLGVERPHVRIDRMLTTVLFTDIVGSTSTVATLGDLSWSETLVAHHERVRNEIARFDGREVETAGDGFFATFDGPARAVRCAQAIVEAVGDLGIEIRAGVHTGEVDTSGGKIVGIAVHIGARVAALAGPSEILVSQTVKDLVAGSGLVFEDAGEHELKGVPDTWRLYSVGD
jgi:class 3 adenylate cyclase